MSGLLTLMTGMAGGALKAEFVGVTVIGGNGNGTAVLPTGTKVGDYMFAFAPYNSTVSGGGTGAWTNDSYTDKHGYTKRCAHKRIQSLANVSFNSPNYGPTILAVYRGPTYVRLVSTPEDNTTVFPLVHQVGRLPKTLGWMSVFADRSGNGSGTPPSGWTKRTGPNATGTFTGELADNLNVGSLPNTTTSINWTGISSTSNYYQSGFFYDMTAYANAAEYDAAYATQKAAVIGEAFYQPTVAKRTYYTTGSMPALGATAFDLTQSNTAFRGDNPSNRSVWICEIDAGTMASNGGTIGFCNDAWIQAWINAYPSSVPGIGGGIFWTTTPGAGYSYLGSNTNGSESGTTVTGYASIQPTSGQVIGIVANGRVMRMYLNGVLKGTWTLSASAALPTYPFVGAWGGRMQGSFRSTPSSYVTSYALA